MEQELLGQRVRHARERIGLSQEAFAAAIGKDQRAVSEYEHGRRRVIAADLPLFSKVLQVPIMYFFDDELSISDLDRSLLEEFHQLPDEDAQRTAIDVIRVLVNAMKQ